MTKNNQYIYICFSKEMYKIKNLLSFIINPIIYISPYKPFIINNKNLKVLGWGLRPTTIKARKYAKKYNLPYIALEDGFLRSLGLGVTGNSPYSIVYDDIGIYYDTTRTSRLEQLILAKDITADIIHQAKQAIQLICYNKLSKYNHAPEIILKKEKYHSSVILIIDQTYGDMAVKYGQADQSDFDKMLDTAIDENPQAEIWIKTHPDVISGKKQGYLTNLNKYNKRVKLIIEDINPIYLLQQVDKVYCVTSQMGFEALLLNKKVVTFGLPWYAGWGLTDDRHKNIEILYKQKRRAKRSLIHLFAAAYLQYSRYIDPNTGKKGSIFDVINYLIKAKQLNQFLAGDIYCFGMSLWKQAIIKPYFNFPACKLHFIKGIKYLKTEIVNSNSKILVWGVGQAEIINYAKKHNLQILRIEDGFIRSIGLGSNLVPPLSLVIDDLGIYFDPTQPSRLEYIIQNHLFTDEDYIRGNKLLQQLLNYNIGKYNVGNHPFILNSDKKIILVPGQVEDDASIHFGSPKIKTNLDLLKQVRKDNPNAYILYKPHPDVLTGNRIGNIPSHLALEFADQIIENSNILDCIQQVDEVHTMTSLAGFEALLRNKIVHCYGLPFYSNWGLTIDKIHLSRRQRKVTVVELLVATLIYYPLYFNPETQQLTNVETIIYYLQNQKEKQNPKLDRSWFQKQVTKLKYLYKTLRN
ncbi:beta-3-deoxy-D-manno-oct-2-ulosonic acid transferase [Mergibacter septicus]|uniref:Beta-3-deoxy-D-manno-oct-2-ulosonic acid transferase n=1 Tax=Mergibacter septicus TaxID=221402 RepID=A0A8D4LNF5_9PAST|nr:capsular polysaccharide biosynthesis protein [Mergibacter septicus]AWX15663.1 beta-3-deoxy-D-manno-oct-2-ulosonic acid transferase [Mergibacter septicus]QDJ14917.1 beta-3-deoxy-D-manno-oct-2-ulosonic acid transferase [Mergibacter septicus]UTU47657.1 capsular polysaccharide biosynthesis protein [Mergibacter septicus]WMR96738.1 capsular polysaccharide biosynthesis protein [Mergibacter septicus]